MNTARFEFGDELKVFLKSFHHDPVIVYSFNDNQTVKHLIEAMGVPHTEVGAILANGKNVNTSYIVADHDTMEIFPTESQTSLPVAPTFVLDNHLGRLANYLRMLGFDCLYRNDYDDNELTETASLTDRVLLTRDVRLLMRKAIRSGYWIRSKDPKVQINEVVKRFCIAHLAQPFTRCMRCNTLLVPVDKTQILPKLQPLTIKYYEEFRLCPGCNQVFWRGSHHDRMSDFISHLNPDN